MKITNEEAIKMLKQFAIVDAIQEDYDVIDMAIEALEKQIPTETNKDIYDIEEPSDRCPNCMSFVFGKYCHNCGQKLEWEELK